MEREGKSQGISYRSYFFEDEFSCNQEINRKACYCYCYFIHGTSGSWLTPNTDAVIARIRRMSRLTLIGDLWISASLGRVCQYLMLGGEGVEQEWDVEDQNG